MNGDPYEIQEDDRGTYILNSKHHVQVVINPSKTLGEVKAKAMKEKMEELMPLIQDETLKRRFREKWGDKIETTNENHTTLEGGISLNIKFKELNKDD